MSRLFQRLLRDERGVTVIEFAIVAPVLCLLLVGLFDIGYQAYAQTVIEGAMQNAARKSALEPNDITTDQLDAEVTASVRDIIPNATLAFTRRNFASFEDATRPEQWDDNNNNGVCDNGEPFDDGNGNGNWDQDRGRDGLGGARDAVVYSAVATFPRVFPLDGFMDIAETVSIDATTVLRNQPFDEQGGRATTVENCT